MELQVRQCFDRSGRGRRTVVAVSGSGGREERKKKKKSQIEVKTEEPVCGQSRCWNASSSLPETHMTGSYSEPVISTRIYILWLLLFCNKMKQPLDTMA